MATSQLIEYFKQYFPLDESEQSEIIRLFIEKKVKRRHFILQQGDLCQYYTFVVSGCFRMYHVDQKGVEHNLQFVAENGRPADRWIADLSSFYSEKPSHLYIEAMEPSTILQIKKADLLYLFINHHKFDRNFRIITEQKYMELQNRVLENISSTGEQRYQSFLAQYPHLANRLPNAQIASYLGITPEFLSKIRKSIVSREKS
ncbi:cAMP-binding domain of CRP or a regulatory subunit of cAMP-dependent protein kinases [Dyadobacter koreensis]|uniref:cAMP-binding domain of CRP or a regulatory subunit of cAMP-dependent protein kinases n=1 Tax=Dyadobacter koreensis TaxID=408657 RepID=A0A1H6YH40_9BACT|nr:Crp/Fnr family transcriptional regulator [Dyadobacter koreensis]SEJ40628.1 cAMP-binding domain of CRP or a regulatory subunit of cAMP-dependent protein kinases [Dyadobacter koreensis]